MSNLLDNMHQFHDNLVHGLSFVVENFDAEFHLDIDYIEKWPSCLEGSIAIFTVVKARLRFIDVTDLAINIDREKSGYTTALSAIRIDTVEAEKIDTTLRFDAYYKCVIAMVDGRSQISFGTSDMFLELLAPPFQ